MGKARSKYSGGGRASDPASRVVIEIGASRRAAAFVMAIGAGAMACVLLSGLEAPLALAGCAALTVTAVGALRREALREGRGAVRKLTVGVDGRVQAEGDSGVRFAGLLVPGSFVAPWLTVVRWRPEAARFARTVLVMPDAVDSEAFRRLRVLLRWGSPGGRGGWLAV